MSGPNGVLPTSETFLIMPDPKDPGLCQVHFFDGTGRARSLKISRAKVEAVMEKMQGGSKSILRASGGLGLAHPFRIAFLRPGGKQGRTEAELRILVRFLDFVRTQPGVLVEGAITTRVKSLTPDQVSPPITLDVGTANAGDFLIDFGKGVVPVYPFHFEETQSVFKRTYFIDWHAVERCLNQKPGGQVTVQRYQIWSDILRSANGDHKLVDFANGNLTRLRHAGEKVIPDALKVGEPIVIPTGVTIEEIGGLLRNSIEQFKTLGAIPALEPGENTRIEAETQTELEILAFMTRA